MNIQQLLLQYSSKPEATICLEMSTTHEDLILIR